MARPIDDGGPAFPCSGISYEEMYAYNVGLSLRDYFAAKAMAGIVNGCLAVLDGKPSAYARGPCNAAVAERAYALADVMLAERAKEDDDAQRL